MFCLFTFPNFIFMNVMLCMFHNSIIEVFSSLLFSTNVKLKYAVFLFLGSIPQILTWGSEPTNTKIHLWVQAHNASNSGLWVWTQTAIFVFLGSNPQSIINNYCFLGLNPQCNVSVSGFKPTINNYWSQGLNPECNIWVTWFKPKSDNYWFLGLNPDCNLTLG